MHDTDARDVAHIKTRLSAEIAGFDPVAHGHGIADWNAATLAAFREALIEPERHLVNLPGGIIDEVWAVTRSNSAYRVLWLPWSDAFSLAVESRYGPVDIGVHGDAIGCFSSV